MKKKYQYSEQRGLPGGPNEVSAYGQGFVISSQGQWEYPGMNTAVPTSNGMITMDNVPYPVYGQDETGYGQMMYPGGGEYQFRGNMVYEIPYANMATLPQHLNLNLPQMGPERSIPFVDLAGSGSPDAHNVFGYGYVPIADGFGISGNFGRFRQGDWKGTNYGISANVNIPINRGKSLTKYQTGKEIPKEKKPLRVDVETYETNPLTGDYVDFGKDNPYYSGAYYIPEEKRVGVTFKPIDIIGKATGWGKDVIEYKKKNPLDRFVEDKMQDYIKSQGNFGKNLGLSMSNFPEDVQQNYIDEYNYKLNSYAAKRIAKQKGYNLSKREDWVDKLTDREREIFANSEYGSSLQPSIISRTLAGGKALGNVLLPSTNLINYNTPGLSPNEQKEYNESIFTPFEIFAPIDYGGTAIANYAKNRGISTGSDYAELPSFLSGQRMANVTSGDVMALNPINYYQAPGLINAVPSLIKAAPAIGKAIGTGLKSGYDFGKQGLTALSDAAKNIKLPGKTASTTSSTTTNVPTFNYPNILSSYSSGSVDDLNIQAQILEDILNNPTGIDAQRHTALTDVYDVLSNEINRRIGASMRAERGIGGRNYGNYTMDVADAHLMDNQQLVALRDRLGNEISNTQGTVPTQLQSAYDDIVGELNNRTIRSQPSAFTTLDRMIQADDYAASITPKNKVSAAFKEKISDPALKKLSEFFSQRSGKMYEPVFTEAPVSLSKQRLKELSEIDQGMALTPYGYKIKDYPGEPLRGANERANQILNFVQNTVLSDDAIEKIFGVTKDKIIANKGFISSAPQIRSWSPTASGILNPTSVRTNDLISKLQQSPLQTTRSGKQDYAIELLNRANSEANRARMHGFQPTQKTQYQRNYANMFLPQGVNEYPNELVTLLTANKFTSQREMLTHLKELMRQGAQRANVGDLITGSTNTSYNSYIPQMDYIFKNAGKPGLSEPIYLGMKPMNDMGFISASGLSNKQEIADYINNALNATQRRAKLNLGLNINRAKVDPKTGQLIIPHYALRKTGTIGDIVKQDGGDMFGSYNSAMNFEDIPDDVLAMIIANNRLK